MHSPVDHKFARLLTFGVFPPPLPKNSIPRICRVLLEAAKGELKAIKAAISYIAANDYLLFLISFPRALKRASPSRAFVFGRLFFLRALQFSDEDLTFPWRSRASSCATTSRRWSRRSRTVYQSQVSVLFQKARCSSRVSS